MSKLAAKLGPNVKRPLQTTSIAGPPAKKVNVSNNPFLRKGEEGIPKEKKELKLIFDINSDWKNGVETLQGFTDFDELARSAISASCFSEKSVMIEGFVLAVIKAYIESDKSDSDVIQKLATFINEQKVYCKLNNIIQALFELLPTIEAKESIPAIASAISNIIISLEKFPNLLFKLVMNDSCGRRLWVDQTDSAQPYYSIVSAFGSFTVPSADLYQQAEIPWGKKVEYDKDSYPCKFDLSDESLKQSINEAVTKVSQRCAEETSKSLIRTLLFMLRNKQIQRAAIKKLDTWLQNVKLQRTVMDLLLTFACNIIEIGSSDSREFLNDLILMQSFRSKQHLIVLQVSIDVLYKNFPSVMGIFMDSILEAEYSPKIKLSHTYTLMHHLYSLNSAEASKNLAKRFVQVLHQQKNVKQVRGFLREFTKTAFRGNDFLFDEFARYIYEEVQEKVLFSEDFNTTELFKNVVNLCAVLPLSAVLSNIKESGNLRRSGNALTSAQQEVLTRYHGQLRHFMAVSVEFLKWAASANLCQSSEAYMEAYNQLLYLGLGGYKSYSSTNDGWPSEVEYNSCFRLVQECVIDDGVLLPLVTTKKPTQIGADKILHLLELLTRKVLNLSTIPSDHPLISVTNIKIIEKVLELSLVEQSDVDMPKISNREMYQRTWFLIFKWIILNKNGVLKEAYENYPLLKMMIHMTVINNFEYPLPMFNGKSAREIEGENVCQEKAELEIISSFQLLRPVEEESNPPMDSTSTFCLFNPTGPPRKFVELFGNLHNFAKEYPIALYLCGIRSPDILGSIANDKLGDQALPVIQDAIIKHPTIVENLPLQTLSQLFFYDLLNSDNNHRRRTLDTSFIRAKLQKTLNETNDATKEIIDYFLAKLCSHSSDDRHGALMAIQLLIGDNTTEEHPINAFSNLPLFTLLSDRICRELSYSVTIESDMKLVMDNISFIAKHMKSGDIHLIAYRLTKIVERVGGKSEDHKQVHHALLEFFASYLKSLLSQTTTTEIPNDESDAINEILTVKIPKHSEQFNISSKVLTGMMTLLCESTGATEESNTNRELLLNTWFGTDKNLKPSVRRVSDDAEVNILPDYLKRKMLASIDERIVNAALLGMTVECALDFLQSSAITPFAYSKLLSIVNAKKPPRGNLRAIATFVRAYKLKGVQGADEFLSYVDEVEGSNSNDQMTFNQQQKAFILDPPPSIKSSLATLDLDSSKTIRIFKTPEYVLSYLADVQKLNINQLIFDPNWYSFTKTLKQKENALVVAKFLKTAEISEELLKSILLSFMDGYRIDNLSFGPILEELAETFKSKPNISALLMNFAAKDIEMDEKGKEDIRKLSADEILTRFGRTNEDTPKSEITRLLLRFRSLCPEIIESNLSEADFRRKVLKIFTSKVPPMIKLIDELATSEIRQTTRRILGVLLEAHVQSIVPSLVINFVDKCIKTIDPYLQIIPTTSQTIVLIDYVIADMSSFDQEATVSILPEFFNVLEALNSKYGIEEFKKVLQNISERIETSLKPPMDEPHLLVLNRLVEELGNVFYGCREFVEQFQKDSTNFTSKSHQPKSMISANLESYFAIIEVFAATESAEQARIDNAIENLKRMSKNVPKTVAGHLQVITDRIVPILAMTDKKHRDNQHIKLLEIGLEIVMETVPFSFQNSKSLNLLLRPYLEFFYGRITYSQRFERTFELLVECCLGYIMQSPKIGKEFLKNESQFFKAMKGCFKIDELSVLIRQIDDLIMVK
uniref:Uncharacterized protein n=1 Tax=Panagrolaimus sp. ES5 TaxID=591445 RepID=A0AC34FBA0_9BILA